MSQEDNVVYLKRSPVSARPVGPEVYTRIREHAVTQLAAALVTMLDSVDDALFERADKAEQGQAQETFFMAMRQLRLGRRDLEENFRAALESGFKRLQAVKEQSLPWPMAGGDELNLALLDNEALEESIAIDGMVTKARTREAAQLAHLQAGLTRLLPQQRVDKGNNPLDPAQIVHAFVSSATQLNIELDPRLILYKLFDKQVLGVLNSLYQEIDRLLPQAGMRAVAVRARPAADRSRSDPAVRSGSKSKQSHSVANARDGVPLLESLRQLLADEVLVSFAGGLSENGSAPSAAAASLSDLVGALSLMQRDTGREPAAERDVKEVLGQLLSRGQAERKRIGALESIAIDIVGKLFEAILDDPQLPPLIKVTIARLQIPVLKAALLDGAFFGSKQHPARRLINEMAQAAIGWVEPAQLERDPLYCQIESIAKRILGEFEDDAELFAELLEDFLVFLQDEQERAHLVEERTRQAAEGKAKVESAKVRVDAEIQRRVSGRRLPDVVHQLLDDAWSKVLFLCCLQVDENDAEWQRQLAVVDRLIASVEPKATAEARRELLTEIPLLLHDLRNGLDAILFNPFEMTQLFKRLEAEHVRCLTVAEADERPRTAASTADGPLPGAPAEPPMCDDLQEYLQQLDEVVVGTWFEFVKTEGSRVRGKLSVRLNNGQRLIFVNRSGFKVMDRTREEFAQDLRAGDAVMLDGGQLFDKALEAVIASLGSSRTGG